jgi:excinuclease UvrABC nuclease subunit
MLTKRKAIEFDSSSLAILRSPGVYMYVRNDEAIYVGAAHKVLGRALARNHHKRAGLLIGTSLILFPCDTYEEAKQLEKELITDLKPVKNQRNGKTLVAQHLAEQLGITAQAACSQYLSPR